jgi:hypothetical protein
VVTVVDDLYTLADLARATGAKRRSLQLWADAGAIMADQSTDRAGTGTHRRFPRDEAIIACVVHAFALHQIAIGELLRISMMVRFWIQNNADFGEDKPRDILETAIKGEGNALLVYESWRDDSLKKRPTKGLRLSMGTAIRIGRVENPAGVQHAISIFPTDDDLEFLHLKKAEGFSSVIYLRNYLSKIDG